MRIGHDASDRHDSPAKCALNGGAVLSAADGDLLMIGNAVPREGMDVGCGAQGSALGVCAGEPEMAGTVEAHRISGQKIMSFIDDEHLRLHSAQHSQA